MASEHQAWSTARTALPPDKRQVDLPVDDRAFARKQLAVQETLRAAEGEVFASGARLHLIAAEIFVVQIFQPLAQIFAGAFFGDGGGHAGMLQYLIFNENRAIQTQSERERVAGPRIHGHGLAV